MEPQGRFRQRFWPLFLLGLLGIATLPLVLVPMIRARGLPEGIPDLPLPALVALSMINPVLYLAGLTAVGARLSPKLALRSLIATPSSTGTPLWPQLRAAAPTAIGIGLALSAITLLLDATFQPFLSPEWRGAAAEMPEPGGLGALVSGLLYGGITEEIMLRWGALSFFAWAAWRLFQGGKGVPSPVAMWSAIVLAALLFGVAHLPAAAALAPLDSILVLRVISLNALGGLFFGWLFWRYHLEAAMLAHASAHVGFALLAWSGLA
jgi:membrane protease YdiL (CAAX protease family)